MHCGEKGKAYGFSRRIFAAIVLSAAGEFDVVGLLAIALGGDEDGQNVKKFSRSFCLLFGLRLLSILDCLLETCFPIRITTSFRLKRWGRSSRAE